MEKSAFLKIIWSKIPCFMMSSASFLGHFNSDFLLAVLSLTQTALKPITSVFVTCYILRLIV